MVMVGKIIFSCVILLALIGCGSESTESGPKAYFVAVDTSKSAKPFHGEMFKYASEVLMTAPMSSNVTVYRFDSTPAEVYSSVPPGSTEEAGILLNKTLQHTSKTDGTNLQKLIVSIDQRIATVNGASRVVILTDCGVEMMTAQEKEQVKRITAKWDEQGSVDKISLKGVQPGFREELRELLRVSPSRLEFVEH